MNRATALVLATALGATGLLAATAHAQTPVFSQTLRGRMTITGNGLGLDSDAVTAGVPGTRGGIGTFIANPIEFPTLKDGSFPTAEHSY